MSAESATPAGGAAVELRAGDWVEVRSEREILATLDDAGERDALPFMPEMLQYCGRRFRVFKSAHKSCDTIKTWRTRGMRSAVHLEGLRCTGEAHGGCQAGCLLYWKHAWLKPVPGPATDGVAATAAEPRTAAPATAACTVETLHQVTRAPAAPERPDEERYRCQATEMFRATYSLGRGLRLYLQDVTSGNITPWQFVRFGLLALRNHLRPFPHIRGRAGDKTPVGDVLGLKPGEWVRVRSQDEILGTLNAQLRHRGLSFDIEMLPYCGKRYRVLRKVERLVDDVTGRMIRPKSACLILEEVACSGCRSRNRMFCPRSIYPYWHEIWLQRAEPASRPR